MTWHVKLFFIALSLPLMAAEKNHAPATSARAGAPTGSAAKIIACEKHEESTQHSADYFREILIEAQNDELKLSAKSHTKVTNKEDGKIENAEEAGYWALKIEPVFPERFHNAGQTTYGDVTITHYLPVLNPAPAPADNYQISVLQQGARKIYIVSSAAREGKKGEGTKPELKYRNLTIFDSEGNLLETAVTIPLASKTPRTDAIIHARDNWNRFCPKKRDLNLFGFEIPLARPFAEPIKLTPDSPLKGLDGAVREEIFQILTR